LAAMPTPSWTSTRCNPMVSSKIVEVQSFHLLQIERALLLLSIGLARLRRCAQGVPLCTKVNDGVATGPGHHGQLHAWTKEDGARRPEDGRRTRPLPRHCGNIGPPGG
jgi:hypothetical protein